MNQTHGLTLPGSLDPLARMVSKRFCFSLLDPVPSKRERFHDDLDTGGFSQSHTCTDYSTPIPVQ